MLCRIFQAFDVTSRYLLVLSAICSINQNYNMYYIVKVRYEVMDDKTGRLSKVIEEYLVDASSISQAEEIVINQFKDCIADFSVIEVKESRIMGVIK
jgi:hypothetical protein